MSESEYNLRAELDAHRKNVVMYDKQFNDLEEWDELRHRAIMLREYLLCEIQWIENTLEKMGCAPDSQWGWWKKDYNMWADTRGRSYAGWGQRLSE